jgi:hypothetical protein
MRRVKRELKLACELRGANRLADASQLAHTTIRLRDAGRSRGSSPGCFMQDIKALLLCNRFFRLNLEQANYGTGFART